MNEPYNKNDLERIREVTANRTGAPARWLATVDEFQAQLSAARSVADAAEARYRVERDAWAARLLAMEGDVRASNLKRAGAQQALEDAIKERDEARNLVNKLHERATDLSYIARADAIVRWGLNR